LQSQHTVEGTGQGTHDALVAQLDAACSLEYQEAAAYLDAARKAAALAETPGTPAGLRLRSLSELGNAWRASGDFARAIEALDTVIVDAEQLPDSERDAVLALAHLRMAIVYDVIGSSMSGLEHLETARRHYQAIADQAGLIRCQMVRAALYVRIDDFEHAVDCYLESLEYYRSEQRTEDVASTLSNLCYVYRLMDRLDDAIAAGEEALTLCSSLLIRASSLANLAFALAAAGRLDEAEARTRESGKLLKELGDPNYLTVYRRAFAWVKFRQGRLTEARELLELALAEATEKGYRRECIESHALLSQVFRELGDYRQALEHFEQHHLLLLEADREKTARQLEMHKFRLELEQAQERAKYERDRRQKLAESLAELNRVHEQLSRRAVELEWHSHRDALTELANRRYFDERLSREADLSVETGANVSLLMIDIDDFKGVNDAFGHLVGDEVLRAAAQVLQAGTRRSDLTARLGGEEFAVLLTSVHDQQELHQVADKLRANFEAFNWDSIRDGLRLTVSIGAASLHEADHDAVQLLDLADRRLYAAKRAGRNQVVSGLPRRRQRR